MSRAPEVLVLMDPLESLKPKKDTSLALIREAQQRGYACSAAEPADLQLRDGEPLVSARAVQVDLAAQPYYTAGAAELRPLSNFRWILMRKDPPVDAMYIWATQIMELAADPDTTIVNDPRALRNFNEKLAIARFAAFCVPTICSCRAETLRAFAREQGDVIFKPLDGMGGQSIFRIRPDDANLNVVIETLTRGGTTLAMAQRFVPEISAGDKRVLMLDGVAWPRMLARIPSAGDNRGNLAAGGTGVVQDLGPAERRIADAVGPWLREQGVRLAGVDVIGPYLTEINITSPTCVREIENEDGEALSAAIWDAFERH